MQQPVNRGGGGGGGGRRPGRQPPRSSGDVSDCQRGSASPHQEAPAVAGGVADEKKVLEESGSVSTMGRRRGGVGGGSGPGPANIQRGAGARQRNRGAQRGGNRAGSGSHTGTAVPSDQLADEQNGVTANANGADPTGPKKEGHSENSVPAQRNGKRHTVNNATEVLKNFSFCLLPLPLSTFLSVWTALTPPSSHRCLRVLAFFRTNLRHSVFSVPRSLTEPRFFTNLPIVAADLLLTLTRSPTYRYRPLSPLSSFCPSYPGPQFTPYSVFIVSYKKIAQKEMFDQKHDTLPSPRVKLCLLGVVV
ncbi:unnamed protein product [Hydatigera taeniaeformis]|uniref:Uncharacterized protein n=1 Tax=Hydatigena taeniaeformis TaxID=6205 RepID=A0A3P7EJ49_HYDTA|nr:unnamed protein product [Hydatigera taeniaeformis]